MRSDTIYKIKDSVDLFLGDGCSLIVYYMNTRQRKIFNVNINMIHLLESIDGIKNVGELCDFLRNENSIDKDSVCTVLQSLLDYRIITEINHNTTILSSKQLKRYARQINYFSEFLGSEEDGIRAQKKIMDSDVLIFGCGAVGGDIALLLAMAGVQKMTLYDYDWVEPSDVSRHLYYRKESVGKKKVYVLKEELLKINNDMDIRTIDESMKPSSSIEELFGSINFVVNTLDEPYIGYTASKISRICIKHKIAHYIAGGFDAHLASTGELIIPYVTPCTECYATYFKNKLKDWKPRKHPVIKRYAEIGGLPSMSLFSSSYACIEIIKCLAGLVDVAKTYKARGEFLFDDFSLTYLDLKKNPDCPICGGNFL